MKALYIKFLGLVAIMMLASCGSKATYLKCEKEVIGINVEGESGKIEIECDGDFNIAYAPEWIDVKVSGSKLKYDVDKNKNDVLRSGFVVLKSGELGLALKFVQGVSKATYFVIPKKRASIDKEGKGDGLKVLTDGYNVKVECPEEVSYSYDGGILTFSSKGHSGKSKTLSAKVTCDEFSEKITILQKGDICATCNGRGYVRCSLCGGGGWLYCPYRECNRCWTKGTTRCPSCGGSGK